MIRTPFAVVFFLILYSSSASAIDRYSDGDSLHVWALSGLVLRKTDKPEAEKIRTIPYGAVVVVQETKMYAQNDHWVMLQERTLHPNQITEYPEARLWGDWVNVRYGDQEGYVFDAYLSRLPAIGVEYKNFSPAPGGKLPQCEPVSDFLKRHFLVVDTLTSARECSKNCATPKFRN